ncbi:ketopantoate reductase family protein [Nocardioides zeae]|uniref:2-dehydropantoate 2-reductase n=1 Tax=Nocardioides zeae TaxID=1457234 RepID=A0AAJ1U6C1_9ACTN|nr:2-dehydropantoate 2-reductase N-terminal domain-containing protein [Nocardioides zeae]MDQ1104942.1 2-dehydropantoate 2-reductase [Nocardioides zeae]
MSPTGTTGPTGTAVRRYVVIGAGGVGAALAAGLTDAGLDVVLVSRGATLGVVRERGLRFTHAGRTRVLDVPVAGGPDEVGLRAGDVLVLATKSQDAAATLPRWAWAARTDGGVGADLPLVLLQNGLETERVALRCFPTVVGGVALIAARHVVTGEVDVANAPRLGEVVLGAYPSATAPPAARAVAEQVATDLDRAGWLAQPVTDIERWLAWKLVASVTFAVGVLSGDDDERARLRTDLAAEARAVLAAAGRDLADAARELTHDRTLAAVAPSAAHGSGQQSPWQAFARGAGSEVDFLNGEVALLGRLHGVPTPLNHALQTVLGRSAAQGEGPGVHSVGDVRTLAG